MVLHSLGHWILCAIICCGVSAVMDGNLLASSAECEKFSAVDEVIYLRANVLLYGFEVTLMEGTKQLSNVYHGKAFDVLRFDPKSLKSKSKLSVRVRPDGTKTEVANRTWYRPHVRVELIQGSDVTYCLDNQSDGNASGVLLASMVWPSEAELKDIVGNEVKEVPQDLKMDLTYNPDDPLNQIVALALQVITRADDSLKAYEGVLQVKFRKAKSGNSNFMTVFESERASPRFDSVELRLANSGSASVGGVVNLKLSKKMKFPAAAAIKRFGQPLKSGISALSGAVNHVFDCGRFKIRMASSGPGDLDQIESISFDVPRRR